MEAVSGLNSVYMKWKWVSNWISQLSLGGRREEGGWRRLLVILELLCGPGRKFITSWSSVGLVPLCFRDTTVWLSTELTFTFSQL